VGAAMRIYRLLESISRVSVTAIIDGASLTPKGALTYWCDRRRKLSRPGNLYNVQTFNRVQFVELIYHWRTGLLSWCGQGITT
jgi:hypothetical protein